MASASQFWSHVLHHAKVVRRDIMEPIFGNMVCGPLLVSNDSGTYSFPWELTGAGIC